MATSRQAAQLKIVSLPAEMAVVQLRSLLLLADEDPQMLARYQDGCQYWALESATGEFVAEIAVQAAVAPATWEIMNLAVAPVVQHQGYGSRLITVARQAAVAAGQRYLTVGTGDADVANLNFYLQNGFRFYQIRTNFFKQYQAPIMVGGLALRDMIVLRQSLQSAAR